MDIEKLKINYKTKNKTWTNPKIKNHKRDQDITQKSITHDLKFLTLLTPSVEKTVNFYGFK